MADGSSSGLSGVLFEAGKTISDAGKKQAQQTANAVTGQLTGNAKPLFGKKPTGSFPSKPLGGQMPQDPFAGLGDFGKMFEGGKGGFGMGPKKPPAPKPQFTQGDLDKMAAENKIKDDQEIAKKQAELEQFKIQHKQLHDEVYFNKIKNIGENSIAQERKRKEEEEEQERIAKEQQAQQQAAQDVLPGNPLSKQNQQLGQPVNIATHQAQTKTEIGRGTTG